MVLRNSSNRRYIDFFGTLVLLISFFIFHTAKGQDIETEEVGDSEDFYLTIEELFRLADLNSKSIRLYSLAVDEASQGINVAKNERLPSLKAEAEFRYIGNGLMTDRDFSNGIHADLPHFGNSFVLKASQVIYAGGAISKNIQRSELIKQIAEQEYNENRQNIRFLLVSYYLDLVQLNNQEVVYNKNIEQTRLLVKDMRAAYKQGTVLKSDITRYELQLQNLELGLTSTRRKINVLNYKLATTIGIDTDNRIVADTTYLHTLAVQSLSEAEWQDEAKNAPRLLLSDLQIELSRNQERLIKAEYRPRISLVGAYDLTGPIMIEVPPLNNNFMYWYAGVGASFNLGALYKSRKKYNYSRITTRRMQENKALQEEETENAIHSAYVSLDEAYVRLRTQKKSVQLAHENFNIVRQRYMNGLALITDLLDASNAQLEMELQLANCQIEILYQYYLLKKISGII